jgi:hypothetical protein
MSLFIKIKNQLETKKANLIPWFVQSVSKQNREKTGMSNT